MIQSKKLGLTLFVSHSEVNKYRNNNEWTQVAVSLKSYEIEGKRYHLVEKWERYLPLYSLERIGRIALGCLMCFFTLGCVLRSTTVQRLFTGRQVVRTLRPFESETKVPQTTSQIEAPQSTSVVEPPKSIPFNKLDWQATQKVFAGFQIGGGGSFAPLSPDQVVTLLTIEPSLKTRDAAQGVKKAYDSILEIHARGIPAKLKGQANKELQGSMQFILFTIAQESSLQKRKELLIELAECLKDCVPVTQGDVAQMHMKFASIGGFDKQVAHFICVYKDKAVDETLYELYPDMRKPDYADEHYSEPWQQFPHMKTGFLALLGKELGLNCAGAMEDSDKNRIEPGKKRDQFVSIFNQKLSIHEIIKAFIIDVNGRYGQIDLLNMAKWCIPDNLGNEAMNLLHDESFEYPSYSPKYRTIPNYEPPYLTERTAYCIFEKLGYITRK